MASGTERHRFATATERLADFAPRFLEVGSGEGHGSILCSASPNGCAGRDRQPRRGAHRCLPDVG